MKPSTQHRIAAMLDKLPECKVVLDALEDPNMPRALIDPTVEDFAKSTGVRFRQQTQCEPRPPHASAYVELTWKNNPEFKIETQDIDFVKQAALRVLNQKRLSERVFNFATKRKQAAQTILKTLESTS